MKQYIVINGELAQVTPYQQQQGGGGGGQSSSVSTPTIAPELKPLANLYVKQATNIANTPYQAYTGQGTAGLTGTQNAGIGMVQNRALGGDQTVNTGANFLQNTMNQGPQTATANPYASQSNPYLDALAGQASRGVVNQFNNATVGSGAFGNSGLGQTLGTGLADVNSQIYGNAFNTQAGLAEQGAARQDAVNQNSTAQGLQAANLGLGYGNQAYTDASQLLNAGGLQQSNNQNALDFAYNQFQNAQNNPYKQLAATGGVVGQNMGQSTSTTQSGGGK
jgi:hypothetical protein